MSKIKTYHVLRSGFHWIVKAPHSTHSMSSHDSKDEAVKAAIAVGNLTKPALVVVYGATGTIEARHSIADERISM